MTSADVLIFGVGSIGAVYLYQLQQAGCSLTAVCRSNYQAVKNNGFTLNSLKFGNQKYKPDFVVRTVEDCPRDKVYDFVLVCTKSFPGSKPSLADMIKPAIVGRPQTAIVLAQNGIDIEKEVADQFPENPILSGVVYLPAIQTAQGIIEYSEMLNLLEIGTYPANAPPSHKSAAIRLAELMIKGGGGAAVYEDIQIPRWSKLLMNAAWNPICALTLCTDGEFLTTSAPFANELVWDIMLEIIALAGKIGIQGITVQEAENRLSIAKRRAETGTGRQVSMLQDVKQGRSFEVEAIVGNTIRLGRHHVVPMPRLETIYALLKARHFALDKDGR